jgi:alpha-mannosidase
VRTFSSQLRYLDEYPEYRFACSQAQQYAWIEERNPDLWERVRAAVERGQFVPVGGSWVEPDCNLVSGESLLRQFLHGQRWFEARLGVRCREFWSPDAFGYPGQLPQLMLEAGLTRFLTQKLSWNRFNKPEHHTFTWQGIDGSEVLGHFPPGDTYSSEATVPELRSSARAYKDHDTSGTSMLLFGHGDGGGGPTRTMLETLRRVRDLQGVPRTSTGTSEELFDALVAEEGARHTVVGELYFEYHRGVYTSQARTKRGNRRSELALHDAEFLVALVGEDVPRAELDRLWKLLLLNQFHDILPGSSIRLVHEEAERDLAEVEAGAEAICASVLGAPGPVAVNTIGFARREVADVPGVGLAVVEAPSYGFGGPGEAQDEVRLDGLVLENAHLRATLAADGTLVSLVEKESGRESLTGPGNRLELYDDLPVAFDAWDVDPAHLHQWREAEPATGHRVVLETPLRAELEFTRSLGAGSTLSQVVRLDAESRRLEFRTTVDWRERHTMLKVCFPLAVRSPAATYETAFGYAERPTHYSTSFDAARYEVPGHRWADLSEHGFGVCVLTDCKYGYSCFGSELRISLLRSPTSPDPEADQGAHELAYAVVPHPGGWREAGIVAEGALFNAPLRWSACVSETQSRSLASVDDPNVVLDTIKPAEDSDAVVLRLYEAHGARGTARVELGFDFSSAVLANALEEEREPLEVDGAEIVLPYRPHQVATVLVR